MNEHKGFFEALAELGERNRDVVILSADSITLRNKMECGRAPQNLINVATGLAITGKVPFCIAPAALNLTTNLEQIRIAAIASANVKIIGTHAGFSFGAEGTQALGDIALARTIPALTIIVPADSIESKKATIAAATINGPLYLRLGSEKQSTTEKTPFVVGRAEILRAGADCTIIACGAMVAEALSAAQKLAAQEIECTVLNCHTIQPIDKHAILASARLTGCVVTAEEHSAIGGLGSAIGEVLAQYGNVPLRTIGTPSTTGASGTTQELLDSYGLNSSAIIRAVKEAVLQKCETLCEVPEEKSRIKLEAHPDLAFHLHSGEIIKSIPGLQRALLSMDNLTFSHHCNEKKNDFSIWVREVFKDEPLARALDKARTRIGMATALSRWKQ